MSSGNRVAVLGLDGVPFGLLERLFEDGVMPRLAEFARNGTFLPMETTIPPISSVAWTSFMTGTGPAAHGIFGFTDLKDNEVALRLPSYDDIRSPVIWNRIPDITSLVVNLPFTYPARPVRGALISGFVAPLFERAVYPEALIPWLKSRGYRIDVDAAKGREDRRQLIHDLFETLNIREEVMVTLLETRPWDLFIGVVTGTDRLHHFFFDAPYDPGAPYHDDFIAYYRRLDLLFGRLQEAVGPSTALILLSDHGFTHLRTQVYLNHMLKMMGYLNFTRPDPSLPEHIHPGSMAFAMDPTRIYINSADRFRTGTVAAHEKETLRARLKAQLEALTVSDLGTADLDQWYEANSPLFDRVLSKEDVYEGECLAQAPDLVILPRRGIDIKATISAQTVAGKDIFTGMHTHDDAFLMVDDSSIATTLPHPKITDVANLVLSRLTSRVLHT